VGQANTNTNKQNITLLTNANYFLIWKIWHANQVGVKKQQLIGFILCILYYKQLMTQWDLYMYCPFLYTEQHVDCVFRKKGNVQFCRWVFIYNYVWNICSPYVSSTEMDKIFYVFYVLFVCICICLTHMGVLCK
jgi:hypothetical protein